MSFKRASSADKEISPPPVKRRVVTTTTNSAVSKFFQPASQKEQPKVIFKILYETLLVGRYQDANTLPRPKPLKIAAFDLDDTLIATKSGNKFARGADDWRWWNAAVPAKLKSLDAEGYAIVGISNQGAIVPKDNMASFKNFKTKVTAILNALDLPITVYAATGADMYRKPRTGMWEQVLADYALTDGGDIDHAQCVFVGDAAGREFDKSAGTKKDHSCSDRNFATNVGISFHTPEEYFLGEAAKPYYQSFDPVAYLEALNTSETAVTPTPFTKKHDVDLVLFCGSPGAGKSTFYWKQLQHLGYERVNQDILKTRDKCIKAATNFLRNGTPVVVDNTNADIETRAAWVSLAKKLNVPVRLVHFTSSAKLSEHNATVRALSGDWVNPEKRVLLPRMAFTGYASRYREPKLAEGYEDITRVDFMFEGSDAQRVLWKKYWIS